MRLLSWANGTARAWNARLMREERLLDSHDWLSTFLERRGGTESQKSLSTILQASR